MLLSSGVLEINKITVFNHSLAITVIFCHSNLASKLLSVSFLIPRPLLPLLGATGSSCDSAVS